MGWLRKKAKQISRAIRKVGRKIRKGLGKVAKAFGKLGPVGSIAMSFLLPGVGGAIGSFIGKVGSGVAKLLPKGASTFLSNVGEVIRGAATGIRDGVANIYNNITDGISMGFDKAKDFLEGTVNTLGEFVGQEELGTRMRTAIRDFKTPKKLEDAKTTFEDVKEKVEDVKESTEYKKFKAVKDYKDTVDDQKRAEKEFKEYQDLQRKRYLTSIAEQTNVRNQPYMMSIGSPQSSFLIDAFQTTDDSKEMANKFLQNVYGASIPDNTNPFTYVNSFNPIGTTFEDLLTIGGSN